jgi:hypothetical protein
MTLTSEPGMVACVWNPNLLHATVDEFMTPLPFSIYNQIELEMNLSCSLLCSFARYTCLITSALSVWFSVPSAACEIKSESKQITHPLYPDCTGQAIRVTFCTGLCKSRSDFKLDDFLGVFVAEKQCHSCKPLKVQVKTSVRHRFQCKNGMAPFQETIHYPKILKCGCR